MKEIIRIHLAKTPYNIEKDAAKALEVYDAAIRASLTNDEVEAVMPDLEIRMVELLAERHIEADGVIALPDVEALKERLGSPADFQEESDNDTPPADSIKDVATKRLYRDVDNALLGGVAAGTAAYFGIDKVWIRINFIILTLLSFGTGVIFYLALWVIIPPARTAAEKLQMKGEPVTLESIKKYSEQAVGKVKQQGHLAPHAAHVLKITGGVILALCALGAFMATVFGSVGMLAFMQVEGFETLIAFTSLGLFTLAGLLLTVLLVGFAAMLFGRKFTSRGGVVLLIITILGALSFFGAVVAAWLAFGSVNIPAEQHINVPQADVRTLVN